MGKITDLFNKIYLSKPKFMKKSLLIISLAMLSIAAFAGFSEQKVSPFLAQVDNLSSIHPDIVDKSLADEKGEHIDSYKNFALELQGEARKLKVKTISSTITFKKPLSNEELISFLKDYDITVKSIFSYANELTQEGYTGSALFLTEDEGKDLEFIENQILYIQDNFKELEAEYIGNLAIVALLTPKQVGIIQNDSAVYLVDVSGDKNFTGGNPDYNDYVQHVGYALYEFNSKKSL